MRPIEAALRYAATGWPVFPCHGVLHGVCSCRVVDCASPGKHPRVARGLHAASTDVALVEHWWQRYPTSNIGVRTGSESGLVVLDIDPAHGGSRSIKTLIDRHGDLLSVPRARTGSGGWHLFFAHPGDPVRNSAGRLGAGLDIRGDGGYVIAPPSEHASGRHYRWEIEATLLPPLPDWIRHLLHRPLEIAPARSSPTAFGRHDSTSWARTALAAEVREVRAAPQGLRNTTLNRSAFRLGQIVGAGLLDQRTVEGGLVDAGIGIGLSERETIVTVRSGLRAGLERPRGPATSSLDAQRQVQVDEIGVEIDW